MALAAGARLGVYEILSPLGAGGMGEVYKARDTRLDRFVAVKILPETLAADPQFRERFDREAKTISQLDHPHICALYDVGKHDDAAFLVMQYLEGETLADRLKTGRLPLAEALTFAIQIADALNAAHTRGIVHRDLKPGNVMVTKSGAKLLDFGLAKAGSVLATTGLSMLPTTPPGLTAQGTLLGTFQYMAPEQLEGRDTDARTDIFAFGAVVYEMITGRKAFEGASQASLISAIMSTDPPPMAASQPLTPPALDHVVRTCLAKNPDARWQNAGDVSRELRWLAGSAGGTAATVAPPRSRWANPVSFTIGSVGVAVGALAVMIASGLLTRGTGDVKSVTRTSVGVEPADQLSSAPVDQQLGEGRPSRTALALSPDGRLLVFSAVRAGRQSLYVRRLDQIDAAPLPGTEDGMNPFFSPDGRWVGFWANGALKKTPIAGGPPTTICETDLIDGASWGSTNAIVFAKQFGGLLQVSAEGGTPRTITTLDVKTGEVSHRLPLVLPGGQAVVFTVTRHMLPRWHDARLAAVRLATGERKDLGEGADARYVSTGHLIFMQAGTLVAAPFDPAQLSFTGGAVSVVGDVMQAARTLTSSIDTGAGQFTTSASGTLAYVSGGLSPDPERALVWVDRRGAVQPLGVPAGPYFEPMLSPDGGRIVVWTQGEDRNVWLEDVERRTITRLTSEGRNSRAIWTPDGTHVAYAGAIAGADNLYLKAADGSGMAERLTTSTHTQMPSSWSPDGRTLAFVDVDPASGYDIWTVPLDGDRQPHPIMQTRFNETYPEFSPDGKWLAYVSNESGRDEVYVRPYPGPGPTTQITNDGGTQPAWSQTGRELFYTDYAPALTTTGGHASFGVLTVPVTLSPRFSVGAPRMLFKGPYAGGAVTRGYDVSADGQRFLMAQQLDRPPTKVTQITLVQNWTEELKQRVPAK